MGTVAYARQRTLSDGGGTFDAVTFEPVTSGPWAVGGARNQRTLLVAPDDTEGFADALRAVARAGAPYVGTWVDGGMVHVDAVDLIDDRQTAFDVAYSRGEASIYHLSRAELLWVHGQDPKYAHYVTVQ